jgi:hypothetical protein
MDCCQPLESRCHFAASPSVVVTIDPPPVGLAIIDSADFDADGKDDLLLRNPATGAVVVWLMNALDQDNQVSRRVEVPVVTVNPQWELIAADDLNGDDKPDLLWFNPALRAANVFLLDGTSVTEIRRIATLGVNPNPWRPIDLADLNNDGRADVIWKRATPAPARYTAWYKTPDSSLITYSFGGLPYPANAQWQIQRFTDFDLDGKTDAFLVRTDGQRLIWKLDNRTLLKTFPIGQGTTASSITLADIDDDGDADLIYQNTLDLAETFIVRLNKTAQQDGVLF